MKLYIKQTNYNNDTIEFLEINFDSMVVDKEKDYIAFYRKSEKSPVFKIGDYSYHSTTLSDCNISVERLAAVIFRDFVNKDNLLILDEFESIDREEIYL